MDSILVVAIALLGAVVLIGIFKTKTPGFGKYSTSVVLLALVLIVSTLLLAAAKIDASLFANIAFAVAGFAGGAIAGKE